MNTPYRPHAAPGTGTLRALQRWRQQLQTVATQLEAGELAAARQGIVDLYRRLDPAPYPEFAANIGWLYRSLEAHLEAGQIEGARDLLRRLDELLARAAEQVQPPRPSSPPDSR